MPRPYTIHMIALAVVVGLALWLIADTGGPALAAGPDRQAPLILSGRVELGSAAGTGLPSVPVDLYTLVGNEIRDQVTMNTDRSGRFRFEHTPASADERYRVVAHYLDVPYVSDELAASRDDLVLPVYEITRELAPVRVERLAMLASVDEATESILFIETAVLTNDGDRTYLPDLSSNIGGMPVNLLRFSLPPGTAELSPIGGINADQMVQVDRGFAALVPVRPGRQDVSFSYRVPYRASKLTFEQTLSLPTDSVRLLLASGSAAVTSTELAAQAPVERLGRRYLQLAGQSFSAGSRVTITFTDLPLSFLGYDVGAVQVGAAFLALAGLAILAIYARQRPRLAIAHADDQGAKSIAAGLEGERYGLLAKLAALDDESEAGGLPAVEYQATRAELKARLTGILRDLHRAGPPAG